MSVKDVFERTDRWDSVGLHCGRCVHEEAHGWPDIKKRYRCKLHDISLAIQLDERGYVLGEWFCKDFQNNGKANLDALATFNEIKSQLQDKILYRSIDKGGYLKEVPFEQLSESEGDSP